MTPICVVFALLATGAVAQTKPARTDALLAAMRDELERSRALRVIEVPYFIEYAVDEGDQSSAAATLGALLNANRTRFRIPRVQVRVGSYQLDNTNFVGTDFYSGTRYDVDRLPLEDSYAALRRHLWLATDMAYKAALEALARKRALLRSITASESLPDFWPAPAIELLDWSALPEVPPELWRDRVRRLSAVFLDYPKVIGSVVDYTAARDLQYLVNSEGTRVRQPLGVMFVRIRAASQADDGMMLRDAAVLHSRDLSRLPEERDLVEAARRVAENLTALSSAPVAEPYTGPVLFEGEAAAQIFAELLARNLAATRRPLTPPGRSFPLRSSELEGRMGARVLPEWMDVVDDPTQKEWRGRPLFGHYQADLEGVRPEPLVLVEKGILKALLLTRQPVRGFSASNGRARLPGAFGAKAAAISNLFIRAAQTAPLGELRKRLIEICRARGKPYGLIVRKMDFPSSASLEEVRRQLSAAGASTAISTPVLVYRLYADGREELVRGLRFRNFNVRSLRDILAASDELHVFDYMENGAPFALMGAAAYVAECTVIAPSVLVDDLELERLEEEMLRPPLVPPPPLLALAGGAVAR
ncbi:MAG: metallopeptidase TldD-related protein [Bryobacterales bacterium]|nr:metallopeptidase TldD-related protein [Bryobacteraceae bacterium]MDW8130206.1 metallopeptidase TldD-related protein [Bryobacterales bacterium]